MKIEKRSVHICGKTSSVTLERPFWEALQVIAKARRRTVSAIVSDVAQNRRGPNLSSSIRIYVLEETSRRTGEQRAA